MTGPILLLALIALLVPSDSLKSQNVAFGHIKSVQVAANTTPVLIAAGNRGLIGIEAFTSGTGTTYVKTYDAAAASGVTCGSGTPVGRYFVPGGTNGSGFITMNTPPDIYNTGIVACFTTGFADTDTTAPAATTFTVNFHWQ